jgi:hypothetical protein
MVRADRRAAPTKSAWAAPWQPPIKAGKPCRDAAACDGPGPSAGPKRLRTLSGAILFDARQIAQDTVLYLSLVGSLLFLLLAFAGWS